MPKALLSHEEVDAEMRRHGLLPVSIRDPRYLAWRNRTGSVTVLMPNTQGFIPVQFVVDALRDAGIEYNPAGAP